LLFAALGATVSSGRLVAADPTPAVEVKGQVAAANQPTDGIAALAAAGHSMHGEAFNDGPRQAAVLMGGTGRVFLKVTGSHPDTQAFFDQGVGQLHGFWYFEAERSFRQVALLDPGCAMAYWGMAMSNTNNEDRARKFIAMAIQKRSQVSPRERLWIEALHEYHFGSTEPIPEPKPGEAGNRGENKRDDKERRRQYIRRLENILYEYPTEVEAKAFIARRIWETDGGEISSHLATDALLDQVFAVEPMHPAHHYRIHLWDWEKPSRALQSAALNGPAAPSIAHMWHMSGHTYSHLHRYADAVWQQEASSRVDHRRMIADQILPDRIHNYAHNEEWLIRNLMYLGQARKALDLAKMLIELPRHPRYNTLDGSGSASFGSTRLAEVLQRFELWEETLSLEAAGWLEPQTGRQSKADHARLIAEAKTALGDIAGAEQLLANVTTLVAESEAEQKAAVEKAEAKAREEKKTDDEIRKAAENANKAHAGKVKDLQRSAAMIRGFIAAAKGDHAAALQEFTAADLQRRMLLSQAQLRSGDKARAEETARDLARGSVNQVLPLANLVAVLEACGKPDEAARSFAELRTIAGQADLNTRPLQRLRSIADRLGYPTDWRTPARIAPDTGYRPDLDSLGPWRWSPSSAAEWNLPDTHGGTVSLADYRGRPVIVIFYLGFGCVHCVEQLRAFAPMTSRFAEAGIHLVAISSDSIESLQTSLSAANQDTAVAFPLLSDASLAAFKAYRVYDDFEQQPLHGAFLVDPQGRVLWHDIGFEPFTDAEFLLAESRRLLRLYSPADVTPAAATVNTEAASTTPATPAATVASPRGG
jgi:peroxiredoxin